MKKTFKKIMSIVLALISCFMLCSIAFANEAEPLSDSIYLVDAKIVWVPLKNRIVFGWGVPEKPNGILIKLQYSDGTHTIEKIVENGAGFTVGKESVNTTFRPDNVSYGVNTDYIIIGEMVMVEYKYLVFPPLFGLLI